MSFFSVQYLIYSCILGLMSCSVFLRINYELKMIIMLTAVVIYNIIILQTHSSLLDEYSRFLYQTESLDRLVERIPQPNTTQSDYLVITNKSYLITQNITFINKWGFSPTDT